MNNHRRIDLSAIDPKEVYRVNLDIARERLQREERPEYVRQLKKQIRALECKLSFNAMRYLTDHPEILN